MTTLEIQTAFQVVLPELESRLNYHSRRFPEPAEAFSEMLASSWINFRSKALRTEVFLGASALAWMARVRLQSGRVTCGYSVCDVLAEQTFKSGRVRVLLLSQLSTTKRKHALTDDEVAKIVKALSTSEHDRPPVRAALRLDWAALTKGLDVRLRKILTALSIGEKKSAIAKMLKISPCRVTQLLAVLADKIREFFGENLPDCCW
jgi:hypothetical protein